MQHRRRFLKTSLGLLSGAFLYLQPVLRGLAEAARTILPRGTDRSTLVDKNPANLDTTHLEVTPLEEFGTMGLSNHQADLGTWEVAVAGAVKKPFTLSYQALLSLPPIEREVLLICPGFFANHGLWKGVSIDELLKRAEAEEGVTHVTIKGPSGSDETTKQFPMKDVLSRKVFLAYEVNGKKLPLKHGFPLRTVAEGYYGYDWVKYVYRIEAEKAAAAK
jgi:DMSO/TMAO reductase YedYZ molybdopterin-dependent catalytic subunit